MACAVTQALDHGTRRSDLTINEKKNRGGLRNRWDGGVWDANVNANASANADGEMCVCV